MTDQLKAMLIRHEGLRLKAYVDTRGNWTIGYGHTGPEVVEGLVITQAQADEYLEDDIDRALGACADTFSWFAALDSVRQDVLVDMVFNMGIGGLKTFHITLACIETGNYEGAAQNMLLSKWRDEVGQRAVELAEIMRTGAYA